MRKGSDVREYLQQREECPQFDPITEFGRANMSLNQSLLARWPDVEAEQRQEQVRIWYEQLRERMARDMRRIFEIDESTPLRAAYVIESLEAAMKHTLLGDPLERTEIEELFEMKLRARIEQILRVLIVLDPDLRDAIDIDDVAAPTGWDGAWGQHGAHHPEGYIGPTARV
jgi:hypothetical protein